MTRPRIRILLNMIVKNESAIIEKCVASLAPHIDGFLICDTGSTDDTVSLISEVFESRGVPGVIQSIPFLNFSQARNEGLERARKFEGDFDYILFCDADMEFCVVDPAWRDALDQPMYRVTQRTSNGLAYPNVRLVRRDLAARYVGATHEYLEVGGAPQPLLAGVSFLDHASGSNRVSKYSRDIALLTDSLATEPDNPRSVFYLANSYFDSGKTVEAEQWYGRRLGLGGYEEEHFISKYRIGYCRLRAGDVAGFYLTMLQTFDEHPERAEPIQALAQHALDSKRYQLALSLARIGLDVPLPESALFLQTDVYEWRLADIEAVALYWLGHRDEARVINERLLALVPESQRERIAGNLAYCNQAEAQ